MSAAASLAFITVLSAACAWPLWLMLRPVVLWRGVPVPEVVASVTAIDPDLSFPDWRGLV